MDLRVIYKARLESVSRIVGLLEKEGFSPTVLDHPDATYAYASRFTNLIRIAVPPTGVPGARSLLARWEKTTQPSVNRLARTFLTQLIYSILATALFGAILFALGYHPRTFLPWLFLAWIPIFAVTANLHKILKK